MNRIQEVENPLCNLCSSEKYRVQGNAHAPIKILRCSSCGLIYAHPIPKNLLERYDSTYFHCDSPVEGGYEDYVRDESTIRKTFTRRLSLLPTKNSGKPVVLDVGCATGVFLDLMRSQGWEACGIEISPYAADIAEKKGFKVSRKTLEETDYAPASFDLITLWDVIEHVSDPMQAIQICHRLLRPGGTLVMSTPDASALLPLVLGNYWLGYRCVGEHVYFFGRKTMCDYLAKAGFSDVSVTSVGKYLSIERLVTRLIYYTRIFRILRILPKWVLQPFDLYVNSGDTMCVIARKP